MAKEPVEIIKRLYDHISPIFNFADVHVDDNGFLRPIGNSEEMYKAQGKIIRVPKSYEEYRSFKKEEDSEVFNPFIVKRHMVFLSQLVREKLNLIYSVDVVNEEEEDIEEADLPSVVSIVKFDITAEDRVEAQFILHPDTDEEKIIAMGTDVDESLALWLACADATTLHNRRVPKEISNAVNEVKVLRSLVEKIGKERKDAAREAIEEGGIQGEDLNADDGDIYDMCTEPDFYLFKSGNDYEYVDPSFDPEADENIILPPELRTVGEGPDEHMASDFGNDLLRAMLGDDTDDFESIMLSN
jgi:hypothetical protein